jgi:hypothetical protein
VKARLATTGVRQRRARHRRGHDNDDVYLVPGLLLDRAGPRSGALVTAQRQQVLTAQHVLGNRWVAQEIARARAVDEVVEGRDRRSYTVRVEIPWAPNAQRPEAAATPRAAPVASRDGTTASGHQSTVEEEGPGRVSISVTDAIEPALTYASAIAHGNPKLGAGEFGLTSWSANVLNPSATANTATKTFAVTADVDCPVVWEVHSRGKTNLPTATSPALHAGNWRTAVSDLTPDLSDDGGRPPRTMFWARDLTERHELYHARDFQRYGKPAFDLARTWLGKQTATTADEAVQLTRKVANQMAGTMRATYLPRAENRAYGDGAPEYVSRAHDIQVNGDAELYPAAPAAPKKSESAWYKPWTW